jgi:hypothetical protein
MSFICGVPVNFSPIVQLDAAHLMGTSDGT